MLQEQLAGVVDWVSAVFGHIHTIDHHTYRRAVPSRPPLATLGLTDPCGAVQPSVAGDVHLLFGARPVPV